MRRSPRRLQPQRVDGVDTIEHLYRDNCLVALQVTDQVARQRQFVQYVELREHFGHPILADLPEAGGCDLFQYFRWKAFRHR